MTMETLGILAAESPWAREISRPKAQAFPAGARMAFDSGSARPGRLPFCRSDGRSEPRPIAPNKPNRRSRPERSAAQSNGSPRPSALSSFAPNKPNLCRFWPKNPDRPKKQTQSKPIHPGPSRPWPLGLAQLEVPSSLRLRSEERMRNEPNCRGFWAENAGGPEKQTQFLPRTRPLICLSPRLPADRMTAAWADSRKRPGAMAGITAGVWH